MIPPTAAAAWTIVMPVKRAEFAKTRLADAVGRLRPELARAFAADTMVAALACTNVSDVIVVTDDDAVAVHATQAGAQVVDDAPEAGLNPALTHGVAEARVLHPDAPVATLSADLPALRPGELAHVLSAAAAHATSFLCDMAGTGTTLYAAAPGTRFEPRFGPGSRAAHLASGAVELAVAEVPTVRHDVDTADDLSHVLRLGVGPNTLALVARLNLAAL